MLENKDVMDSIILREVDLDGDSGENFASDLDALLSLPKGARERCLQRIPSACSSRTVRELDRIVDSIAIEASIPTSRIKSAFGLMLFLAKRFAQEEFGDVQGEITAILRRLTDSKRLDTERSGMLGALLTEMQGSVPTVRMIIEERRCAQGVLPVLVSAETTVELRGSMHPSFKYGESPRGYHSSVRRVVGIVSLHIDLDSGFPDEIFFQMDRESLTSLLDTLSAAKQDLEALEQYHSSAQRADREE